MATVELKNIVKVYDGDVRAVDNANITVKDQEFLVLVAPLDVEKPLHYV